MANLVISMAWLRGSVGVGQREGAAGEGGTAAKGERPSPRVLFRVSRRKTAAASLSRKAIPALANLRIEKQPFHCIFHAGGIIRPAWKVAARPIRARRRQSRPVHAPF
jgi:hypothetical protein